MADRQIRTLFGSTVCDNAAGQAAFTKLVNALREPAGLDISIQTAVLATPVPNAFAPPGGKVYLFNGLLARAQNPDEIAGVLAHELGHLRHRDSTRNLIYNGGTSFLIGLLFGDITGSSALIFASRSILTASYTREAEQNADTFSIDLMHRLGRPTKPMGELLFRVTGKESDQGAVLSGEPSADGGPLAAHERGGSAAKRPAAVDGQANGRRSRRSAAPDPHPHIAVLMRARLADLARRANHFAIFKTSCPASVAKIFCFTSHPNQRHESPRPAPSEGRSRSSRTWGGMRWTLAAPLTNGA